MSIKHYSAHLGVLLAATLAISGCTDATGVADQESFPSEVRFTAPEFTLTRGDVVHLEAEVYDQHGQPIRGSLPEGTLLWETSDETIAEVTPSGRITGIRAGAADISVALPETQVFGASAGIFPGGGNGSSKRSASANVEVQSGASDLRVVKGNDQEGWVNTALTDSLKVRAIDENGNGVDGARIKFTVEQGGGELSGRVVRTDHSGFAGVTWTLGPVEGVGRVDAVLHENGFKGAPTIFRSTAVQRDDDNSGGGEQVDKVRVVRAEPSSLRFEAFEDTATISGRAYDENGDELEQVSFDIYSLNSHVATVNGAGLVSAEGNGSARVVVAAGGLTDTVQVEVEQIAASVAVSPTSERMNAIGDTVAFDATARDANGFEVVEANVEWTISDPAVAVVKFDGRTISAGVGAALVTASVPCGVTGCTADAEIEVRQVVADVELASLPDAIEVGETEGLSATVSDSNGVEIPDASLDWSSSDASIASVDNAGRVTGESEGTTSIRAAASDAGVSDNVEVSVGSSGDDSDQDSEYTGTLPELPRVYLDTDYQEPGGSVIRVEAGENLQSALNNAQRGDIIELEAGATWTGNFELPEKSGSGQVVIRSSAMQNLPPEGSRVGPEHASSMARIVAPDNERALITTGAASYYRLMGIEITVANDQSTSSAIVEVKRPAHSIVFDRTYIHGHETLNFRRCIMLNADSSAVIDSYVSECHGSGFDSQAILAWNTNGPLKITNNYLEGAGENVFLGGAMPGTDIMPRDIEIRGNHIRKPWSWQGEWTVKNLFEIKFGQRVLIEGNVMEGNWKSGQDGMAINIKLSNEDGRCTWCETSDITFRRNIVRDSDGGFKAYSTSRLLVEDNLIYEIGTRTGENRRLFMLGGGTPDLVIRNNTALDGSTGFLPYGSNPSEGAVLTNNIVSSRAYGVKGDGKQEGTQSIDYYFPNSTWDNNCMLALKYPHLYPEGTIGAPPQDEVISADFRPGGGSVCAGLGADMNAVEDATEGVVLE